MAKEQEDEGACWSRQQIGTRPSRESRVFITGITRSVSLAGTSYVPNEQQLRTLNARVVIRDERGNGVPCSPPVRGGGGGGPLLGGLGPKKNNKGQLVDGPKEKWRPDLEVVKATIRFLEQTGRLDYRRQVAQA
jgi:hypothetical protein